eukprot:6263098-Amphidinium_carterae.1
MLKTEGPTRFAPEGLPPTLWRTLEREKPQISTPSITPSASSPSLPKLSSSSPSKRMGAQAASKLHPLHTSPQKTGKAGTKAGMGDTHGIISRQHGLTVMPLQAKAQSETPVDREGFLRAQLADTSAELGSLKAQLEGAKAELALVGIRRRDKAQLPKFSQTSYAGFPSWDNTVASRRDSAQSLLQAGDSLVCSASRTQKPKRTRPRPATPPNYTPSSESL